MEHLIENPGPRSVSEKMIEDAIEEDLQNAIIPDAHAVDAKALKKSFESNFSMLLNEVFEDAFQGKYFEKKDKEALSSKVTQKLLELYDQKIPGFAGKYNEVQDFYDGRIRELKDAVFAEKAPMDEWLMAKREKDAAIERALDELISPHDVLAEDPAEEMSLA